VACAWSIGILITRGYYTLRHFLSRLGENYNPCMEKKIFWMSFTVLGLLADFLLPLWWALGATIPIIFISWWIAYRSEWF
jgi:hypothetical protein